jgi:hypothetical protein
VTVCRGTNHGWGHFALFSIPDIHQRHSRLAYMLERPLRKTRMRKKPFPNWIKIENSNHTHQNSNKSQWIKKQTGFGFVD